MVKRIGALVGIFVCASVAWMVLGTTIFVRTNDLGPELNSKVASSWGSPQEQKQPSVSYQWKEEQVTAAEENGKSVNKVQNLTRSMGAPIQSTRVGADLHLDYRRKGLLWFSTYGVKFDGTYTFRSPPARDGGWVQVTLPFPAQKAMYDNVEISVDGQALPLTFGGTNATAILANVTAGDHVLHAAYRSQGLESWSYNLSGGKDDETRVSQARDFDLIMRTDFSGFDFPENGMSPTAERRTLNGWELEWKYQNLVSGYGIALVMPKKLQPGPLAGRISYFAPVSLFFFFFVIFMLSTLRGIDLHPMNYFFLACAFFAFHLLMAYLVDHVSIHVAFLASSVVSIGLVVSYLRLVVNARFAVVDAGLSQLVYLVLFSYAFFFEGFTGLAVTIGAILSLFVVMQMTGRIKWDRREVQVRAVEAAS